MIPDLSEKGFCHFVGGAWRVPDSGGVGADLARAVALARPAPGAELPDLPSMPALFRPGAVVLLAPRSLSVAALAALDRWCALCAKTGQPRAGLSLIQPIDGLSPPMLTGWCYIPLFRSSRL